MLRATISLLALLLAGAAHAAPGVDFQREVRPILSENCFQCHGPDKGTRMANLRLDTRDGASTAIVPRNAKASKLYQRVSLDQMPPAFTKKTLSAQQKDVLRRWIEQGASWKEHWSFQAPV